MSASEADRITELLKTAKTIAVVGLTDSPLRPSFGVSHYMLSQGYRIIPVNPNITDWMGEKSYPSLLDVPEKIDIVNIFRRSGICSRRCGAGDSDQSSRHLDAGGRRFTKKLLKRHARLASSS